MAQITETHRFHLPHYSIWKTEVWPDALWQLRLNLCPRPDTGGQMRTSHRSRWCWLVIWLFRGARALVREENLLGLTYHGSRYGLRGDGGSSCYELLTPWGSPINLLARGGVMRERASKRENQIHL